MAVGSTRVRQPAEQCPNCLTGLRPRDRFCAACGMRLERPDLRAGGQATPAPAVPLVATPPQVPSPFAPPPPAAAPQDRGVAAALVAVLLVAMISLTIALLVAVAGEDDDAPTLVTTPQVVTTP